MTEIKYDPELPFVVLIREDHGDDVILARCSTWDYANQLVKAGTLFREIVDTTPKPKIPENAEFIHYLDSGGEDQFGRRGLDPEGNEIWWTGGGHYSPTKNLLEYIGEVTVLVRKEET